MKQFIRLHLITLVSFIIIFTWEKCYQIEHTYNVRNVATSEKVLNDETGHTNDINLPIWPEDAIDENDDRIFNQFNYKPKVISGMKQILLWRRLGVNKGKNILSYTNPMFGCPVHQCEVTVNRLKNETADLIIFGVIIYHSIIE